ncbi:MAG: histidine phosphatase family protein, partial [Deltaproteobacteria bacterium]|nr:histidine phosphatase family protein [Deltaproteobacteria bacterium]
MRFILIRHGETRWNELRRFQGLSDIELSPKGKRQAENLAESMRWEKIQALYTSPLLRARQTAEEIACFHNCSVAIDDRLKELNLGKLEGLDSLELKKRYPDFL